MPKAGKGVQRKQNADGAVERRIVILDHMKCKPNTAAYKYLQKYAGACGKECIVVQGKRVFIWEEACAACIMRAKKCPDNAVSIIKLPTNLETDTTHRYGENMFKLHGLPAPRPGHVLGILGTNGIGKSTALKILSGKLKPNLGVVDGDAPMWEDIIKYYRGSDLQNYFTKILTDELTAVIKPQMDTFSVKSAPGRKVKDVLAQRDERGTGTQILKDLDLSHLMDREIGALSGGEMQRLVIGTTSMQDADVFMYDETSSFLDVRQRLAATDVIRSLIDGSQWGGDAGVADKKYIVCVEHDLAVLDYMSDHVCCLYGEAGVYGVVTQRLSVHAGINQFLAGFFPGENMRFRDHALDFRLTTDDAEEQALMAKGPDGQPLSIQPKGEGTHFAGLSKTLQDSEKGSTFTLNVEPGNFRDAEIIGLLGENGCGKTTFMKILAGAFSEEKDAAVAKKAKMAARKAAAEALKAGGAQDAARAAAAKAERAAKLAAEPAPEPETAEDQMSLKEMGVSFKRQHNAPRFRKFPGTVAQLFERTINAALGDRRFRLLVMVPMMIEKLMELKVTSLSGGELQRVAITVCLGTPASVYLIDEPSAGLDCEQRVIVAKVIKRWIVNHLNKTAFIVEHDFVMATALAERVIVFDGTPGVECTARSPQGLVDGVNSFLEQLEVTFRRDPESFRPRVNKKESLKDREQKSAGTYFMVDDEPDDTMAD